MKKKRLVILILIIIAVAALVYYMFFYFNNCKDNSCFSAGMKNCDKVKYVDETADASWIYIIKGERAGECVINVELAQAKKGDVELENIEGLHMDCYLPIGFAGNPQEDLKNCHGLLKEQMQELIIQKMHSYILSNLGEVSEALESVV